ncbi:MAG: type II toxin-antitoxin system Phd/YefM family antitoxin [Thermomicrobiales bacterium]
MMKKISATEAKNRLGTLINDVAGGNGAVTIEHHGRPRVVVVSAEEWAEVAEMRERLRRHEAWQRLMELAREVSARNADLSQEEADALADEIADEAMDRVVARARLRWAERSS